MGLLASGFKDGDREWKAGKILLGDQRHPVGVQPRPTLIGGSILKPQVARSGRGEV